MIVISRKIGESFTLSDTRTGSMSIFYMDKVDFKYVIVVVDGLPYTHKLGNWFATTHHHERIKMRYERLRSNRVKVILNAPFYIRISR